MAKKFINPCVSNTVQAQKTIRAAVKAAGAVGAGPATERAPVKQIREWYTIVVYEKPRAKTVVLYVGREAYTFKVPAEVNIGNVAVIMRRWLAGGKTPACSASIHIINLAKLLNAYAREVAGVLEPVIRAAEALIADVVERADGAQPEAYTVTAPRREVQSKDAACSEVKSLIIDMRSDMYLAVRMDEFVESVNNRLRLDAEERGQEPIQITADDVKRCLKYDDDVKVVADKNGVEGLWLWSGAYAYLLVDDVAKMALKYGAILAEPEKYIEDADSDGG
jgi:hypothetical protein